MTQAKIQIGAAQKARAALTISKRGNAPASKVKIVGSLAEFPDCREYSHQPEVWLDMFLYNPFYK